MIRLIFGPSNISSTSRRDITREFDTDGLSEQNALLITRASPLISNLRPDKFP